LNSSQSEEIQKGMTIFIAHIFKDLKNLFNLIKKLINKTKHITIFMIKFQLKKIEPFFFQNVGSFKINLDHFKAKNPKTLLFSATVLWRIHLPFF